MIKRGLKFISELPEDERESAEQWIGVLTATLGECECYLRDYGAGEQNVLKVLGVMHRTHQMIVEAGNDLMKGHRLPGDFPAV